MPYLIKKSGVPYDWSPYRYAVYLHWMHSTAAQLDIEADLLELTLFDTRGATPRRSPPPFAPLI